MTIALTIAAKKITKAAAAKTYALATIKWTPYRIAVALLAAATFCVPFSFGILTAATIKILWR